MHENHHKIKPMEKNIFWFARDGRPEAVDNTISLEDVFPGDIRHLQVG
jgi:hypothetical protein